MRLLLLIATALAACSLGAASAGESKSNDFAAGKKVYVAKCAKCHKFYEPKSYSDADWEAWMKKMVSKSKLKPKQEESLRAYVNDYRSDRDTKATSARR